jgi:two-component system, sensor histidine kinase and response regulator
VSAKLTALFGNSDPVLLRPCGIGSRTDVRLRVVHVHGSHPTAVDHGPGNGWTFVEFLVEPDGESVGVAEAWVIKGGGRVDVTMGIEVPQVVGARQVGALAFGTGKDLVAKPRFGAQVSFRVKKGGREAILRIVGIHGQGDAQLTQVIGAGDAPCLFLGIGKGREQESCEDGDDGDDDEQLDEGETVCGMGRVGLAQRFHEIEAKTTVGGWDGQSPKRGTDTASEVPIHVMPIILIVDDDVALRNVVRLALEAEDYGVLEAADGAMGVQMACANSPDLILCDVRMEGMDGYRMLAALRQHSLTASIPFILMTGHSDTRGMRYGMELGADDYLAKPFGAGELTAAVAARLKKQQTVREHAEKKLADLRANISLALPHELLTPLNGIMGFAELLISDPAGLNPEEVMSMSQAIRDSADRLNHVIGNILVFVQLELRQADQHAPIDPEKLLDLKQAVRRVVRERAVLQSRTEDVNLELGEAAAAISEDYFGKIVGELTDNAFKFSDPVTPVQVRLMTENGHCVLAISDRGRGMKPDHVAQVGAYMQFERRFYEQQGSGLGLAIAKRLTELHGGKLSIASVPGEGTTVEVRLPRRSSSASAGSWAHPVPGA